MASQYFASHVLVASARAARSSLSRSRSRPAQFQCNLPVPSYERPFFRTASTGAASRPAGSAEQDRPSTHPSPGGVAQLAPHLRKPKLRHPQLKASSSSTLSSDPPPPSGRLTSSSHTHKKLKGKADLRPLPHRPTPDGQAIAYSTAEWYDIAALQVALDTAGLVTRSGGLEGDETGGVEALGSSKEGEGAREEVINVLGEAIWVPRWPSKSRGEGENTGEVFIFENGSFVTWGLSPAQADEFLNEVIRNPKVQAKVEQEKYPEDQTETLDFYVDPKVPTLVRGDSIILGETALAQFIGLSSLGSTPEISYDKQTITLPSDPPSLLTRLALSSGLTRSTKLSIYESLLDAYLSDPLIASLPDSLMKGSEAPLKKEEIVKRFGQLVKFREGLYLDEENLLDQPEFLWGEPKLEEYYNSISRALDFQPRLSVLNTKMDYAFDLQSTLMDLLSTKTSHRLEWIIIVLITVEVALAILRDGLPDALNPWSSKHVKDEEMEDRIERLEKILVAMKAEK